MIAGLNVTMTQSSQHYESYKPAARIFYSEVAKGDGVRKYPRSTYSDEPKSHAFWEYAVG
jgi:hypothetical protein